MVNDNETQKKDNTWIYVLAGIIIVVVVAWVGSRFLAKRSETDAPANSEAPLLDPGLSNTAGMLPSPQPPPPPPPPETEYIVTKQDTACCGGGGGNPYPLLCPNEAYVQTFEGSHNGTISSLGIKCSDGTSFKPVGGTGGTLFGHSSEKGFTKLDVRSGNVVDRLSFINGGMVVGSAGGTGGNPGSLSCTENDKIVGVNLHAGNRLDKINIVCGGTRLKAK